MLRRLAIAAACVGLPWIAGAAHPLPLPADPAALGDCNALPVVIAELAADGEADGRRLDALTRLLTVGPDAPVDLADLLAADPRGPASRPRIDPHAAPTWLDGDSVPLVWRRCRAEAVRLTAVARERLQIGAALAERRREFLAVPPARRLAVVAAVQLQAAPALAADAATAPAAATTVAELRGLWTRLPTLVPDDRAHPALHKAWRRLVDLERQQGDPARPAELDPLISESRRIVGEWRAAEMRRHGSPQDERAADAAREWFVIRRDVRTTLENAAVRLRPADASNGERALTILREVALFVVLVGLLVLAWRIVHGSRAWLGRRLLEEFRRASFQGDGSRRLRLWRRLRRHQGWIPYGVGVVLIPLVGALLRLSALPELAALVPWAWAVLAARAIRDVGDRWLAAADPRRTRMRRSTAALSLALPGGWVLRDALVRLGDDGVLTEAFTRIWWVGLAMTVVVILDAWRGELAAAFDEPDADRLTRGVRRLLAGRAGRAATLPAAFWWLMRAAFDGARHVVATIGRTRTLGDLLFRWRARQIAFTRESAGRPPLPAADLAWLSATPPADVDGAAWRLPQHNREQIAARIESWLAGRTRLPLALVGPAGSGHSTALAAAADAFAGHEGLRIHRIDIKARQLHAGRFIRFVAEELGAGATEDPLVLARELAERRERALVLVDNADRLFLRRLGGFEAYRALLKLAAEGGERTLWVASHHTWSWHFLTRAVDETAWAFESLELVGWRAEDLARLIDARLAGIGRNVDWETLAVLDEEEYPDEQRLHDRFYRVLREQSRGIPGVALALAADAFGLADDGSVAVHLAELPDGGGVVDMGADVRFVLAALAIHGDMLPDEILAATRLPAGVVATLIGRLIDRGVLARGEGTLRITPAWVTAITDSLRRRGYLHGG